jgi:hypothetical protein
MPELEIVVPEVPELPHLTGFEAYCENCKEFRLTHRADEVDAVAGTPYSEFCCSTCFKILLTFQRVKAVLSKTEEVQASEVAVAKSVCSATCPHCGALNTFPGWSSMLAFICRKCGEGVVVRDPVQ